MIDPLCKKWCYKAKKVVLFPEIGRAKIFVSVTHPHSRMFIRIYVFNLKKTNKQVKNNNKNTKKAK